MATEEKPENRRPVIIGLLVGVVCLLVAVIGILLWRPGPTKAIEAKPEMSAAQRYWQKLDQDTEAEDKRRRAELRRAREDIQNRLLDMYTGTPRVTVRLEHDR
jgi:hypothetical protein